ncbi:hypothetical protein EPYR_02743 [Erwinia pyrifoliae DSM 12163]|nr:hypothetical protein EPYR_02743 [Erwinia pyrifoliae DSM 12163]
MASAIGMSHFPTVYSADEIVLLVPLSLFFSLLFCTLLHPIFTAQGANYRQHQACCSGIPSIMITHVGLNEQSKNINRAKDRTWKTAWINWKDILACYRPM